MVAGYGMADNPTEGSAKDNIARPVIARIHHPVGDQRGRRISGNADLRPAELIEDRGHGE